MFEGSTKIKRVLDSIDAVITPIYSLGDDSGVSLQDINKKYRSKPGNMAEIIYKLLDPCNEAKTLITTMKKKIHSLEKEIQVKDAMISNHEVRKDLEEKIEQIDTVAKELRTHATKIRT